MTYLLRWYIQQTQFKLLNLHVKWLSTTSVFYFSITLTVNRTHNAVAT